MINPTEILQQIDLMDESLRIMRNIQFSHKLDYFEKLHLFDLQLHRLEEISEAIAWHIMEQQQ